MPKRAHSILALSADELELMLQFVLASGSLKDLGHTYRVSYPTIRARVDRLIARLRQVVTSQSSDPMMQLLAELVERGEITVAAAQALREAHRQSEKNNS